MSGSQLWVDVDDYFTSHLSPDDEALRAALRDSETAGLPPIAVTAAQGKLLQLLALAQGARHVLEIGTLGGYSTIWLGRALPEDGRLITLEYNAKHADVAVRNISRAGLERIVEVRVGPALESLPKLADENPAPFDLTRAGSLIILDNVVREGRVADARSTEPDVVGTRAALELIASHPRLSGTAIQTVGLKGYDGFALARVQD
jgi:predicted O-methyltransferase YrrM